MSLKKIDRIDCRINLNVKLLAKDVCRDLGMSLTEAINLFLHQLIIHHGLPFEVKMSAKDRRLFIVPEDTALPDDVGKTPEVTALLRDGAAAHISSSTQGLLEQYHVGEKTPEEVTREKEPPDSGLTTPDASEGEELLQ